MHAIYPVCSEDPRPPTRLLCYLWCLEDPWSPCDVSGGSQVTLISIYGVSGGYHADYPTRCVRRIPGYPAISPVCPEDPIGHPEIYPSISVVSGGSQVTLHEIYLHGVQRIPGYPEIYPSI